MKAWICPFCNNITAPYYFVVQSRRVDTKFEEGAIIVNGEELNHTPPIESNTLVCSYCNKAVSAAGYEICVV